MNKAGKRGGLLREPLVHFLIIGALVFGLHSFWMARQSEADRTISLSSAQIQRLTAIWASEAGREPTVDDVQGLVSEYVREEVLYREALRLGLNRDDTIIRRRLAQKMGFLITRDETVVPLEEAELREIFEANPGAYAEPPRISFIHVPFNFPAGDESREAEMGEALSALKTPEAQTDWTKLGDPFLLSRKHTGLTQDEVARLFGREFAGFLFGLNERAWSGPHRSRLAWHLVRIEGVEAGGVPAFETIIDTIRARETERLVRDANDAEMAKLLERYTVKLNDDPA